jgi:hypothetical protein
MAARPLSWLGSFFGRAPVAAAPDPEPNPGQPVSGDDLTRAASKEREEQSRWRVALLAAAQGDPADLAALLANPQMRLSLFERALDPAAGAVAQAAVAADTPSEKETPLGLLVAQAICAVKPGFDSLAKSALNSSNATAKPASMVDESEAVVPTATATAELRVGDGGRVADVAETVELASAEYEADGVDDRDANAFDTEERGEDDGESDEDDDQIERHVVADLPERDAPRVLNSENLLRLARALESPVEMNATTHLRNRRGLRPDAAGVHEAAALAFWARVVAAERLDDWSLASARFAAPALLTCEGVDVEREAPSLTKPLSAGFGGDPWRVMAFVALRDPAMFKQAVELLCYADLEEPSVAQPAPFGVLAWDRALLALLLQDACGEEDPTVMEAAWLAGMKLDLVAPLRVASQALTALLLPKQGPLVAVSWRPDMASLRRAFPRVRDLERRAGAPLRYKNERWSSVCENAEFSALFLSSPEATAPSGHRIDAPGKAQTASAQSADQEGGEAVAEGRRGGARRL